MTGRADSLPLPDVRSEVIARYVSSSPGFHRRADSAQREAFIRSYRWHLKGWLDADRDAPWLDLACGQGQLMSLAISSGFLDVKGVDLSQEMLSVGEELGLSVRVADALESVRELPSAACGVVSAFDFLEHLGQNEGLALLREVRRVLRPAGVMLIRVPNGASTTVGHMFHSDLTHRTLFTPSSIEQIATLAGFSRCEVREVGPAPHGIRSVVRYVLWKGVRSWYRLLNAIETGSPGAVAITQVMLVRLTA